ncbi:VWA domain-containing protein [Myxococcota bacterium]|nr:VWA domain-containing protein [Myxococcota bacterium]
MMVRIQTALLALIFLSAGAACTDSSLEILAPDAGPTRDNKLTVKGEVCTESPEDLIFPLRVLFLVDASESMKVADPPDPVTGETGRERAVRETAERLLDDDEADVKVSVVRFSSQAQPLTPSFNDQGEFLSYFTSNLTQVQNAMQQVAITDRTTNYLRAFSEAYAEIRHELMNAPQESLALSTYQIIMISDGLPDSEGSGSQRQAIVDAVNAIKELQTLFHVGSMDVNTAFIATGNPSVDAVASDILETIAETGEGTYRSFASGGDLNFLYIDLSSLRRVFTLRTLVAQNINAVVKEDIVYADSDGDGLADTIEWDIGSSAYDPDTDGDGCRDSLEYSLRSSGMDPTDPKDCPCFVADYCFDEDLNGLCDCPDGEEEGSCCTDADLDGLCDCVDEDEDGRCDSSNYLDDDGDGLNNCEERYAGSNRQGPDTDGDGLVDFLELRFAMAPDINETADDFDWDGVSNGEEVKTGSDPRFDSSRGRSDIAYRYKVQEKGTEEGSTCFDFEITNITITEPTSLKDPYKVIGPAGQGFSGANRILIFVGEVPFDDLDSYARFRVGCVEANYKSNGDYKNPPSGIMSLREADFVSLQDFDPYQHCVKPGERP